jgi:hypothetical protein
MKTLITIAILILYSALNTAQDSSDTKNKEMKNQIKVKQEEMKQVQKRIGPEDKPVENQKMKTKGKDVFIDKDGDGICDTRQGGMSFNKLRKRYGKQAGSGGGHKGNNNLHGNGR